MTPSIKGTLAAGLAAATILSGLSFGTAAATAAPAEKPSSKASTNAVSAPFQMIYTSGGRYYAHYLETTGGSRLASYSTLSEAQARASTFTWDSATQKMKATGLANSCLGAFNSGSYWRIETIGSCDGSSYNVTFPNGVPTFIGNRQVSGSDQYRFHVGTGAAWQFVGTNPGTSTALTASVTSVNNVAKSAVIGGTATKSATIKVGTQQVTANATTGAWSMTITGLANGANSRTVEQHVGGTKIDQKVLSITVLENGAVVPTTNPAVQLERGGEWPVVTGVTTKVDDFRSITNTTMVYTAPEGTTFKSGQATLDGEYKHKAESSWSPSSSLQLKGGVLSNGNRTLTYTNAAFSGAVLFNDTQVRWSPTLVTAADAAAGNGTVGFDFSGSSNKGSFRAQGSTPTVIPTKGDAMTAEVVKVNNIAGTAVVEGTASPRAKIRRGNQETTANSSGLWSMTIGNLGEAGTKTRLFEQYLNNSFVDEVSVQFVYNPGVGTIASGTSPAVEIAAGETKAVQVLSSANGPVELPEGTMTFTAPEGTTFPGDQDTIDGQFQQGGTGNWSGTGMQLTDGERSDDGKTYTFNWKASTGSPTWAVTDKSNFRWSINVAANTDADAASTSLGFVLAGDAKQGDFRAEGSTAVTIQDSNVDLTALLQSTDHVAKSAVIGGIATPGATIRVGAQTVVADAETGDWTMTLADLATGANEITVEQLIGGTKIDDESLTITILENGGLTPSDYDAFTLNPDKNSNVQFGIKMHADGFTRLQGTVVLTAPAGTAFKSGLPTLQGQYRHAGQTSWTNAPALLLTNGTLSEDARTLTFTQTNTTPGIALNDGTEVRWGTPVTTPAELTAGTGTLGFTFEGTSNKGTYRAAGTTDVVFNASLTAGVSKVNNIARSAVIGGTATPGATVKVGTQEVTAHETTGAWSMTVTGLAVGEQNRTVEQLVNGTKVDQKVVAITVGENGTIVPGTSPAVEITAGETKAVQVLATANGALRLPEGTIEFTAPEGTTFPAGQNTINGQYQMGGSGGWAGTGMQLTDGVRSDDGKTYTYNWKASTGSPTWAVTDKTNFRWSINVAANADAASANTSLGFVLAGDATQGDFRAQGSTVVNVVADDVRPITVRVDSVDSNARSARVSGNATPNAEIRVGTSVIGTANASGAWSGTVTGLSVGANDVLFEQFIRNEKANDVRQVINVAEQVVPFTVTAPVHESTIVAPDGQVTFRGTGQPGGKVSIMYGARLIGKVDSIPANGEWNFTATMNYFDYEMTVYYKKSATGGLTSQQPLNVNVTSGVANRPFEIVTPTNNSTIGAPDKQVTFSGNGTPGARVSIMHGARNIGSATVGAAGTWSFAATMNYAEYNLTAYYKRTPSSDVYQVPLKITVNAGETGFAIGTPAEGGTVTAGTFNVAGTGKVGSRVSVFLNGSSRGSATTNAAGDWTIPVTVNTPGTYTFDVYYKANPTSDYADLVPLTLTVIR